MDIGREVLKSLFPIISVHVDEDTRATALFLSVRYRPQPAGGKTNLLPGLVGKAL